MKIIERIKGIVINPKNEWSIIALENQPSAKVLMNYLLPLAFVPAVASLIGYGFIGIDIPFVGHVGSFELGIKQAVVQFISTIAGVYLAAFIIDALAPNFGAAKNFDKSFELVAYSYTPMLVAGVLMIFPALGVVVFFAGIYGLYLLYIGLKPIKLVSEEKCAGYFIVSLIVLVVVSMVLSFLLSKIFLPQGVMNPMY